MQEGDKARVESAMPAAPAPEIAMQESGRWTLTVPGYESAELSRLGLAQPPKGGQGATDGPAVPPPPPPLRDGSDAMVPSLAALAARWAALHTMRVA